MTFDLTLLRLLLAQGQSSNVTDFLGQISGLVALTCGAGVIWVALTAFVMQRAAERRRRAAEGLAPLPSVYTSLWSTLRGERSEEQPAREASEPDAPVPTMPDLALLLAETPVEETPAQPLPRAPEAAPPPESQPGPPNARADVPAAPPETDEVLRVWRDRDSGALIVEIDGQRFMAGDAPPGSDLERRFASVVRDLRVALPSAGDALPRSDPPAERGASTLRQIGRVAIGQPVAEPPTAGPRSIAEQIEELLQDRLARQPEFSGRSIHVRPSLHGGVNIVIDNRQFEGIGEVDDPAVRALLQDVVRQWEATQ